MEEPNAITVLLKPEMAQSTDTMNFFEEISQIHIAQAPKRAKLKKETVGLT